MKSELDQRLSEICDDGFIVFANLSADTPEVIAVDSSTQWVTDFLGAKPGVYAEIITWMQSATGILDREGFEELSNGGSQVLPQHFSLVSALESGQKIGVLAGHKDQYLSDIELREITAAAQMLVSSDAGTASPDVTAKEEVYLQRVANGASDDDIAEELGLSLRAIKERKRKAIEDMNAKNISHAVAKAKRENLI